MPDPLRVDAYNRYMYSLGNPLKFNDPTGHCIARSEIGEELEYVGSDDQDCWRLFESIINVWDNPDAWGDVEYWNQLFGSKEIFRNYIAPTSSNDFAFFSDAIERYYNHLDSQRQAFNELMAEYNEYNPNPSGQHLPFEQELVSAGKCANNFPMGCANTASDVAAGISVGGIALCVLATDGLCLAVVGGASTFTGSAGSIITTVNYANGDRNVSGTDVAVSWGTTSIGGIFGGYYKGFGGAVTAFVQRQYDRWRSQ